MSECFNWPNQYCLLCSCIRLAWSKVLQQPVFLVTPHGRDLVEQSQHNNAKISETQLIPPMPRNLLQPSGFSKRLETTARCVRKAHWLVRQFAAALQSHPSC